MSSHTSRFDEVFAAIDKANRHVSDLCQGKERWTMHIPARPDMDSDLIISDALAMAADALKSVASERQTCISAGGSYELKLYATPGYVGTIAGITIYADPEVPENTVLIKDQYGRELGRIINVGK